MIFGTTSLDKDRSSNAAAFTDRSYNMTVKGNLSDTVYTEQLFMDGVESISRTIRSYPDTQVVNISDGAFVEGSESMTPSEYLEFALQIHLTIIFLIGSLVESSIKIISRRCIR